MRDAPVDEGVYLLGRLSAAVHPSRTALLREMAKIVADAVGIECVGVSVYEKGILSPATACYVHGPWGDTHQDRFLEQSRWHAEDRILAKRIARCETSRLYHRDELIEFRTLQSSRLYNEFQRPYGVNDQAIARYQAPDGTELLFGICAIEHLQRIPRQTLETAQHIGSYLARSWCRAWRHEPDWMQTLKPTNREVITLALQGLDDHQIAEQLGLTYHAVRAHLKRAFRLAGVRSRLHLMQSLLSQSSEAAESVEEPTFVSAQPLEKQAHSDPSAA